MTAEHVRLNILDGRLDLLGNEGPESCRVEDAGHSQHTLTGKSTDIERQLRHRVQRIADHDQDRVG